MLDHAELVRRYAPLMRLGELRRARAAAPVSSLDEMIEFLWYPGIARTCSPGVPIGHGISAPTRGMSHNRFFARGRAYEGVTQSRGNPLDTEPKVQSRTHYTEVHRGGGGL